MTSIDTSALSARNVWQRFIASADTDGNGSLSEDELAALSPDTASEKIAQIVSQRDANGDGVLSADELPKGAFSTMAFEHLLNAQEYRDATSVERREDDARAIADLFARADVDGNGVLSDDEWSAERALSMSAWADSGDMPEIALIARTTSLSNVTNPSGLTKIDIPTENGADESAEPAPEGLRPEDFMVGRLLSASLNPTTEIPQEIADRLAELKRADGLPMDDQPSAPILDPETVRQDVMARVENTPMSSAFMVRLLMSLEATA